MKQRKTKSIDSSKLAKKILSDLKIRNKKLSQSLEKVIKERGNIYDNRGHYLYL